MRTTTTSQEVLLSNPGALAWARLRIKDSGGTWQDWSNLAGTGSYVGALDWGDGIDARYQDAKIEVHYHSFLNNASPLIVGNRLSGYLDIGREVEIAVALAPDGVTPDAGEYEVVFHGVIQSYDLGDELAVLDCRDRLGALLADRWIEADTTYGDGVKTLDEVMQDILDDWGDGEVLWVPGTAPSFVVNEYNQQPMAVLDALRELALLIGADLRPLYRDSSGEFELALTEPNRLGGVPSYSHEEWVAVDKASVSRDDIRNVIQVNYPGGNNDAGQREWRTVWAANNYTSGSAPWRGETPQAGSSIAKYGRRWMEVSNGTSSGIDNATEAQALADIILADLAEPDLDWGVELPGLFWPVELNDYYSYAADGVRFDGPIAVAVMSYRHRIDEGGAQTTLSCSGKPKAGRQTWLEREARPGASPTLTVRTPGPTTLAGTGTTLGAVLDIGWPTSGGWDTVEVHRSTNPSFTPGAGTLLGTSRSTRYIDSGLEPNDYYYKTRVLDADGNTGDPSLEVEVTAERLPSDHIEEEARRGSSLGLSSAQSVNSSSYVTVEFDTITAGAAKSTSPDRAGWDVVAHEFATGSEQRVFAVDVAIRLVGDGSSTGATVRVRDTGNDITLLETGVAANAAGEANVIRLSGVVEINGATEVEIQIKGAGGTPTLGVADTSIASIWPQLYTS